MTRELGFLGLLALLGVGSLGWGTVLLRVVAGPSYRAGAPTRVALGAALFVAVGGLAVRASIARADELVAWLGLGVLLVVVDAARNRRFAVDPARTRHLLRPLLAWLSVSVIALFVAAAGSVNPNDDDAAYLYLAKRLLATGDLVDPFNLRRVTSFGGGELFSSLALLVDGSRGPIALEWSGWVLLCTALVAQRISPTWRPSAVLVVGAGIALVRPVGVTVNSAPTFSGVALLLATLCVLSDEGLSTPRRALLAGLLTAASLDLRLEFFPLAAIATATCALLAGKDNRIRSVAAALGGFLVGVVGWSLALLQSSKTPFFPLIDGTWNASFPWDATLSTEAFARRVAAEFGNSNVGLMLGGSLLAALFLALKGRRDLDARRDAIVLGAAILGSVVEVVAETSSLSGGALGDVCRYDAPGALVCLLFAISACWSLRATTNPTPYHWALQGGLVVGLCAAAFWWPPAGASSVHTDLSIGIDRWTSASVFVEKSPLSSDYDRINEVIPKGATVLAAVDDPGELDFSRFTFDTLDIPDAAALSPGIPLFSGERAVVSYLKAHGFDGVVATSRTQAGLYHRPQWKDNAHSGILDYRVLARYFLAWFSDLQAMRDDPRLRVLQRGQLVYIAF